MARHPAAFGPTATEVLTPESVPIRPRTLAELGARDVTTDSLSVAGRAFLASSGVLFDLAPRLREVRFVAVRHVLGGLVRCPHLARLRAINLSGNRIGPVGAELLAGCEHLTALRELDLTNNSVTDAGVSALCRAPWADSVSVLRLGGNGLTVAGEQAAENRFGNRLLLT